ncbi:MAG: YgiQ family radical SAM protein [Chloroflexota bacterium]
MFIPTTTQELTALGWDRLDIILVSGDTYIDSPLIGSAVIGKVLINAGYRVGIIAQPDIRNGNDITRLGEPRLFWGVTAGSVDSMVANFTSTRKRRRRDDYTPGGLNNRRPNRASMVYTNLIRQHYKDTVPIVLGGLEASLRRIAHYDYWSDSVRASLLVDSKADFILYGMAEQSVLALAQALRDRQQPRSIRGLCYLSRHPVDGYLELPPYETARDDQRALIEMFHLFYRNNDPINANGLVQRHGDRYLVQNPPAPLPDQAQLDAIFNLDYERAQHPYYEKQGAAPALETIRFSITTHRGCYGECNFCAIAVHEGCTVYWRSTESILTEVERMTRHPQFKGIIQDLGGPTANMYGFECAKKLRNGICPEKRCLFPQTCSQLKIDHSPQVALLRRVRAIPAVRKVFVASGIRYDMVLADQRSGKTYLREIASHHTSGQLKIAPEHSEDHLLKAMGKPAINSVLDFKNLFDQYSREAGKKQYLTYYFIAAYPGCSEADMERLRRFASLKLKIHPEQVQIFTPTPSTYSSLAYYTETDPFTGEKILVEKEMGRKERQKRVLTAAKNGSTRNNAQHGR